MGKINALFVMLVLLFGFSFAQGVAGVTNTVSDLCNGAKGILPVAAMLMVVLAGVIYAAGQVMGAETRARANVWATACLTGALISVLIVVIAPPVLSAIYPDAAGGCQGCSGAANAQCGGNTDICCASGLACVGADGETPGACTCTAIGEAVVAGVPCCAGSQSDGNNCVRDQQQAQCGGNGQACCANAPVCQAGLQCNGNNVCGAVQECNAPNLQCGANCVIPADQCGGQCPCAAGVQTCINNACVDNNLICGNEVCNPDIGQECRLVAGTNRCVTPNIQFGGQCDDAVLLCQVGVQLVCSGGTCVGDGNNGAPCNVAGDCNSNNCDGTNHCAAPACVNAGGACQNNYDALVQLADECCQNAAYCKPALLNGGNPTCNSIQSDFNGFCNDDADCRDGLLGAQPQLSCKAGVGMPYTCLKDRGQACAVGNECMSGTCTLLLCT